jgi:hypothetical protein
MIIITVVVVVVGITWLPKAGKQLYIYTQFF